MSLSVEECEATTRTLKESHEELRQLATLKESEAAIARAKMADAQKQLLDMQAQLLQQQEMIQSLLANLAAGKGWGDMEEIQRIKLAIRLIKELDAIDGDHAPRHRPEWYDGKHAALRILKAVEESK